MSIDLLLTHLPTDRHKETVSVTHYYFCGKMLALVISNPHTLRNALAVSLTSSTLEPDSTRETSHTARDIRFIAQGSGKEAPRFWC